MKEDLIGGGGDKFENIIGIEEEGILFEIAMLRTSLSNLAVFALNFSCLVLSLSEFKFMNLMIVSSE